MLSLSRQSRPHRCILRAATLRAGFTLIEIVIALAVLGTMAAAVYIGFNGINTYAVSSRLYSEAQAVCQNQIDLILSKDPFDVTTVPPRIPALLAIGQTVTPNVFIYQDPVSGKVIVSGTMTTTISDANLFMDFAGTNSNLNVRRATVTVSYTFRDKNYAVSMDTLRTANQ